MEIVHGLFLILGMNRLRRLKLRIDSGKKGIR